MQRKAEKVAIHEADERAKVELQATERLHEECAEFGGKFELNRIEDAGTHSSGLLKYKGSMREKRIVKGKPMTKVVLPKGINRKLSISPIPKSPIVKKRK